MSNSHRSNERAGTSDDSSSSDESSESTDEGTSTASTSNRGNGGEEDLPVMNALNLNETSYEWLEDNPWQDYQARDCLKKDFDNLISCPKKYQVNDRWKTENKVHIDLQKVYDGLQSFIQEVSEKWNPYNELENVIELLLSPSPSNVEDLKKDASLPLTREIIDKKTGKTPKQGKSPSKKQKEEENKYTAQSLPDPDPDPDSQPNYVDENLDVNGYILKVSVPKHKKKFLKTSGFTSAERPNLTRRWIFIPSYMRANCGLFDWSEAGIDEENTIRIIVVRPSEFEEYRKHIGNVLPIISLPNNRIGIGYARYWIQKIATSLDLEYIWMIDDDVKQFYEVHPDRKPNGPEGKKYAKRRRRFNEVFTKFESIVKANEDDKLAAISPLVFDLKKQQNRQNPPFVRKPPRVAVFLNLKLINQQSVYYCRGLIRFEDMFFGKECEENNLKVIMWKRIQVYSMNWK